VDTLFPELPWHDARVDELIRFATAVLAEEEAAARAATTGTWNANGEDIVTRCDDPHWDGTCVANAHGADAAHIVLHDPGRALLDIAAKRLVLAVHLPVESICGLTCKRCVSWSDAPWGEGGETEFGIAVPDPWPCLPVRGALAIWAARPGYRAEWALDPDAGE
jgi:hypothetical protein